MRQGISDLFETVKPEDVANVLNNFNVNDEGQTKTWMMKFVEHIDSEGITSLEALLLTSYRRHEFDLVASVLRLYTAGSYLLNYRRD